MSTNLSTYTRNKLIDHVFRTATFSKIGTLYFALSASGSEVSGGNYARVAVTPSDANFNAPSASSPAGRKVSNANPITFNTPSASWGTVDGWAVYDAASGGNLIASGALTAAKTIGASDPAPQFPASAFSFTVDFGSNIYNDLVLNFLFRTAAWSKPSALYFGLYTTSPDADGGGTEVSGGSYARVAVTPGDAAFAAPVSDDGHTENLADIEFPAPSGAAWGAVEAVGVFTAASGGNLWLFDDFAPVNVNDGDAAPRIATGQFDHTINA